MRGEVNLPEHPVGLTAQPYPDAKRRSCASCVGVHGRGKGKARAPFGALFPMDLRAVCFVRAIFWFLHLV